MLKILIHNDGTGNHRLGNYNCVAWINDEQIAFSRVECHKRGDWKRLVKEFLESEICEINDKIF